MIRFLYILLIISFMVSCSTTRKLQKSYNGKPVSILKKDYGIPSTIIERKRDTIYIYEKADSLRSTEISQGRLTLDPIITPAVVKTERFYFTVEKGIITEVRSEDEYKR
ncbi:MAG TPA: hypothetical protein VFD91_17695 [Mariniphaga sp.]|nr:hypothetical protein [Mariniphaga sp.]